MGNTDQQQPEPLTNGRVRLGARVRGLWNNSELHAFLFEPRLNGDIEGALIEVALYLNEQALPEDIAACCTEVEEWACYRHGYFRTRRRARWLDENRWALVIAALVVVAIFFLPEILELLP